MAMMRAAMVGATALAAMALTAGPSLSAAEIEKATGLKGVHEVPATAPGAVPGRDNFADANGKVVLWFQSMSRTAFLRAKGQHAKMAGGIEVEPALYHVIVTGIGDEAFDSPDGKIQHAIYVRRGEEAFGLISNVDASGVPRVTMDQLTALAKLVVSRM